MKWAQTEQVRLHGSRVHNVMRALAIRQPQVKSGIVYMSAEQLAELAGVDERTVRRAVADLVELGDAGPVVITRPNPCAGERCGYVLRECPGFHGGKTLDEDGHPTGAANGFSVRTTWIHAVRTLRLAPTRAAGRPTRAEQTEERDAALRALERRRAAVDERQAPPDAPAAAGPAPGPLAGPLAAVVGRLPQRGRGP